MKAKDDIRTLNELVYLKGIDIKISDPYNIKNLVQLNRFEKLLQRYARKFHEDAVVVSWGQPYGGPDNGFKVHKNRDINRLKKKYIRAGHNARGLYPHLGPFYDSNWISKKRDFLRKREPRKEFDLDVFLSYAFSNSS